MGDVFIVFFVLPLFFLHKVRLKVGPSKMMKNRDIRVPRKMGGWEFEHQKIAGSIALTLQ